MMSPSWLPLQQLPCRIDAHAVAQAPCMPHRSLAQLPARMQAPTPSIDSLPAQGMDS